VPDDGDRMRVRDRSEAARADGLDEPTAALFEHLRRVRLDLARDEGVAAYMVFPDRTLIDMARSRPTTRADMRLVQGVGERKLDQYGATFLDAIAAFERRR
jgi:ATP-dependent DNA helicase RecQ